MESDNGLVLDARRPLPRRQLDLLVAGGTTVVAASVYLAALAVGGVPPPSASVIRFATAPVFALLALVALELRLRSATDAWVSWFCAGLTAAVVAMALQVVSFPLVDPSGGPFSTSGEGSAGLYLLFHVCVGVGALAGVVRLGRRHRWVLSVGGTSVAFLLAADALPLPNLLTAESRYTSLLLALEWLVGALLLLSAFLWTWRGGRDAPALRGWIALTLLIAVYEIVLNALAAQRFTPVWWGSLSLRVLTFAVLAIGVVSTMVLQLRDVDRYSETELDRREAQLREALQVSSSLMVSAEQFSRARTTAEVAGGLGEQVAVLGGHPHHHVLAWQQLTEPAGLVAATEPQVPEPWRQQAGLLLPRLHLNGEGVYLQTPAEVDGWLGDHPRPAADIGSLVLVPLGTSQTPPALLVTWSAQPRQFSPATRRMLAGVVSQAGQAWGRAAAYEDQARAAATLQASLLPARLHSPPGLTVSSRYVAGEQGLRVGGDWFDCLHIDEHQVAVVVGDVMGKGLHAAAVMGQVRTTLRTLARLDPNPGRVLEGLDALTHELAEDEIATVTFALVDLHSGVVRIARAGHVPPLLVPRSEPARYLLSGGSPPLGVPAVTRPQAQLQLSPGDVMVLYTDGLVEDRVHGLDLGMGELMRTAERLRPRYPIELELCTDLLLSWSGQEVRGDDVALMVVRFDGQRARQDGTDGTLVRGRVPDVPVVDDGDGLNRPRPREPQDDQVRPGPPPTAGPQPAVGPSLRA
ncbi:PP2C family protein-serine/threonine phosphatase [Nocardioides sp. MAHUQ-72]|uniref:PP2C family protein-serine/threonine phosphatase n=1 Tax=unclassified Nocardioides TaxID=2615069 RepID=UPI0036210DA1